MKRQKMALPAIASLGQELSGKILASVVIEALEVVGQLLLLRHLCHFDQVSFLRADWAYRADHHHHHR